MSIENRIVIVISGPKANVDNTFELLTNALPKDQPVRILKDYREPQKNIGNYEP